MAIVIEGLTGCALCGEVLGANADLVMFPHFIQNPEHPLWRFSDSGMHRTCFIGWDRAQEFRDAYSDLWPTLVPQHPRAILADGTIIDLPK